MFVAPIRHAPPFVPGSQPRAEGEALVAAALRDGASRLSGLSQRGSARCMVPRTPGRIEAVFLNTAGGLTGGDRLDWAATAEAGAFLTVSTQAAERAYRAQPGETARVRSRLEIGAGARLDWLPQETILFDGADLDRRLDVEMAVDARLTAVETVALGRLAMGETSPRVRLRDVWRVRRAGRLVYADALRLDGPPPSGAALWAGARAAATLIHAAPDVGDRLAAARGALDGNAPGLRAGASVRDGVLVARLLAPDAAALRAALLPLIDALREAPPPRVWRL